MFQYTDLREKLSEYLTQEQVEQITQAYLMAEKAHQHQKRFSGEPYITHPVEVARILAHMHLDYQSIMAALLHDTIEDTSLDKLEIKQKFGDKIAELVDGVSKLTNIHFDSKEEAQAENFRKMMLAMTQDIRVIIIKLADRLHNMRTLSVLPPSKRARISLETLEIYAPIAHRLGMNNFKVEFEDLGFMYLHPLRYRVLKEWVRKSRGNRKALVSTVEKAIKETLAQSGMSHCIVKGREKYLYSLYKKMRKKRGSLSDILDIYGFRIIVDEVGECYRALGLVHNLYRPVSGRFKDYIAIPKANGYQSLHTSLHGPFGVPIEVQIRTQSMEQIAENGIAAHWNYKDKGVSDIKEDSVAYLRTGEWLQGLLDIQENTGDSLEFIKNIKIDLYPEAVYVFTPTGKILSLPQGATPVDFAYLVHTDIGNHCIACKINRKLSPLSTRLESGQIVEIITSPCAQPNPAWLSFALTGKTRSNIRHWLKIQQRSESRVLGRRLVNTVLTSYGQPEGILDEVPIEKMHQILSDLKIDSVDSLYEEIGLGKRLSPLVAQVILKVLEDDSEHTTTGPLYIKGTEGLIVTYANCCYPIPGDLIVGHLIEGQGITVHTEQCVKVSQFRKHPLNCINVQWAENIEGEFEVPIEIEVVNERGVLAILANTFAEASADIVNVSVDERDGTHNLVKFIILVKDRAHLAKIIKRFRSISVVTKITRGKSALALG